MIRVSNRWRWIGSILCGLVLMLGLGLWVRCDQTNKFGVAKASIWGGGPTVALRSSVEQAQEAANLAQTANSAEEWDQVVEAWMGAISSLQSIPARSPERMFTQRKQREYLTNLAIAQQQAEQMSWPDVFPSLGSAVLDDQVRLYLSYLATVGPPDILIVGSSRALQGLDPKLLQTALANQGHTAKVFNFSINGATAQVMNFILQRLLSPEQLPKLIIWGDGSRAFNSRRLDATFARILSSPGYQAVQTGARPSLETQEIRTAAKSPSMIDAYGFLPVSTVFDPDQFYQTYPRVSGRYDGFYNPFGLTGLQDVSLRSLVGYLKSRNIDLIYVHLPLSGDYLDDYRRSIDTQFQRFLQTESQRQGFSLIDLLFQWVNQDAYFADPSHLNQLGAAALSQQLARNPIVLEKLRILSSD